MTGKVYKFDKNRTLKNPRPISAGNEVIGLEEERPLTPDEKSRYMAAKGLIRSYMEVASGLSGCLDTHLEEASQTLRCPSGNFLDAMVEKVGRNWIKNYLQMTEYLQSVLHGIISEDMESRHKEALETIAKYEDRYTRERIRKRYRKD